MAEDGDYPLVVYIRNTFNMQGPTIEVTHYYYYAETNPDERSDIDDPDSTPNPDDNNDISIKPGETIGFPLHWKKQHIEIKSPKTLINDQYYIFCEPNALCRLIGSDIAPDTPTHLKTKDIPPTIPALHGKKRTKDPLDNMNTPAPHGKKLTRDATLVSLLPTFYRGGAWEMAKDSSWTLRIQKLVHDPEEVNVTVGEDPPT